MHVTLKSRSRSKLFSVVGEADEVYHWCEWGDDCFYGYQFIACYDFAQLSGQRGDPVVPPSCQTDWVFIVGLIFGN